MTSRSKQDEAAAGDVLAAAAHWVCPCGQEPPKRSGSTPVTTIVSLREPACPFCGRGFREEYRREAAP